MYDFLGLPQQASAHAHYIDESITLIHWLMVVLFSGWFLFLVVALLRFRRGASPTANYVGLRSKFPYIIVGAVAAFELTLLVWIDLPLWAKLTTEFPKESDATVIRVVGEQFAWNAHYAGADGKFGQTDIKLITSENPLGLDREDAAAKDDITTINQISFPVNKPVLILLSSKDVIHSFGVPMLRVKQDAIPGQRVKITFVPTKTSIDLQRSFAEKYPFTAATDPATFAVMSVAEDYKDRDGNAIAAKDDPITAETISKLLAAGVHEIDAYPSSPVEVVCSQLCGLGHYRMRASVNILSDEDYQKWLATEASYLQ